MSTLSKSLPQKRRYNLFNRNGFSIFALREYLINHYECWIKQTSFKLMPGFPFVGLGTLAGSFHRAGLCLFVSLHFINSARFMTPQEQISHALALVAKTQLQNAKLESRIIHLQLRELGYDQDELSHVSGIEITNHYSFLN